MASAPASRPAGAVSDRPARAAYGELAAFFDGFASSEQHWRQRNRTYHRLLEAIYRFHVPPASTVLEIGCGSGDLLAALRPAVGVGVDVSSGMVELARRNHPELEFVVGAGEDLALDRTFDVIVLSDLVPYAHDLLALFRSVARHSHPRTRVVINSYSQVWRPVLRVAELLRAKPAKPVRNWVAPDDVQNLLQLAGLETVTVTSRILAPKQIPVLSPLLNAVANIWPLNQVALTYWVLARPPAALRGDELRVSVVCPCRNEQGHIADIVSRVPEMGAGTELIFVEGGSQDETRAEIERQIALHPGRAIRLLVQRDSGKGAAVREGFAAASGDVLMILDGDLTVPPESLPAFFEAIVEGRAELVNGSRLVYNPSPER